MPSDKLQQIALEFHIDIADMTKLEAGKLCEEINDYIVKHYNVADYYYSVKDGE